MTGNPIRQAFKPGETTPELANKIGNELASKLTNGYGLSVVQNPQNQTVSYDRWQGNQKPMTSRDFLRMAIDAALRLQPDGFDALMQMLEEVGCLIKRGAHISIKPPDEGCIYTISRERLVCKIL